MSEYRTITMSSPANLRSRRAIFIISTAVVVLGVLMFATSQWALAAQTATSVSCPPSGSVAADEICSANLWKTGVDNNNAKLGGGKVDPHYWITGVYNNSSSAPCEPGVGTPRNPIWPAPAITVSEFPSGAGTGYGPTGSPTYPLNWNKWGQPGHPWRYMPISASWIGLNSNGHDSSSPECVDPSNQMVNNINIADSAEWVATWNTFVVSPKQKFSVQAGTNVDTSTFQIQFDGSVDNLIALNVNPDIPGCGFMYASAYRVDPTNNQPTSSPTFWENPDFNSASRTSQFKIPSACLKTDGTNDNSLSFHLKSGWTNTGMIISDIKITADLRPTPPVTVSCGSMTVSPTNLDPYSRFIVQTRVKYTRAYAPVNPRISLALAPLVPFNGNANPATPLISGTVATATYGTTANGLGPTGSTGEFTATWTYTDSGGLTAACTDKFTVVNRPYLTIYGGDAVIGNSPTVAKSCYTKADGGVYGWNSLTPTFKGAGAQYAVMALGTIKEFASNLGAGAPDKLAFANAGAAGPVHNVATGLFGGKFGATSTPCDFISDLKVAQQQGPSVITSLFSAPFSVSGEIVKYAKGDVYIANNVVYSGTSWASVSAIPSFKLVVEGDIYVDNNVTQLDGLYVALYNAVTNKGGNIYTCATSIGNDVKPGTLGFYNTCKNKLTVNGAFIAKQVHFLRTIGSLGQATSDNPATGASSAAEVFNYSPELWLPRNTVPTTSGRYDVITGLPPVL